MGVTHVGRGVVLTVRVGEKEERGCKCGFNNNIIIITIITIFIQGAHFTKSDIQRGPVKQ